MWSNGTADLVRDGKSPSDMMQRLKAGYEDASNREEPPVEIARVGELWGIDYSSDAPIVLHNSDGSHPNLAGSYLAGLDIFATIYGECPKKVGYHGTLGENEADVLKDLVSRNFPVVQSP